MAVFGEILGLGVFGVKMQITGSKHQGRFAKCEKVGMGMAKFHRGKTYKKL